MDLTETKTCIKCEVDKPLTEFRKHKSSKGGRRARCKACLSKEDKRWREANREYLSDYNKRYREENLERLTEYHEQWREKNKDRLRAANQRYKTENADKVRINNRAYQARLKGASGELSAPEWVLMCWVHEGRCAKCGEDRPLTLDHITPLARGGSHEWDNIQPLCLSCNSGKRDHHSTDYRRKVMVYWTPNETGETVLIKSI